MTSITIERARGAWRFTAEGHATGAPEACAGVSALLYALAGWLRNAPAGTVTLQSALSPGRAEISFRAGAAADTAAELTAIGLAQIAARYPDAVEVGMRGGRIAAASEAARDDGVIYVARKE